MDNYESFFVRAVKRMSELGMISNEGRDRMLESGEPKVSDAATTGAYMALLAVALWHTEVKS